MTVISTDNRFEWDSEKNEVNKEKHGLSFPTEEKVYYEYYKRLNS